MNSVRKELVRRVAQGGSRELVDLEFIPSHVSPGFAFHIFRKR